MRFFSTLLALVAAASAIPFPNIVKNSERLARNLPPLPPKFRRTLPGHARDIPTPAYAAKRSAASPYPVSYTGRIEVRNKDSSILGHLRNTEFGFDGVSFVGEELHVSIQTTSTGEGPFDILAKDPKWKDGPYVGAASSKPSHPSPTLGVGSGDTLGFFPVEQTPRGSPPVAMADSLGESAIWSIDPSNKKLTAHWVNPDGSKPNTVIAYDIRANRVFFTGDIDKYNSQHQDTPSSAVDLFLVNDS